MTKVFVFDTNSIISAHLLPYSISRKAYSLAFEHGVLVHSVETLSEFVQTFARPKFDKYIDMDKRSDAISAFERKSFLIEVSEKIIVCRDPKDNKFLELGIAAQADCIITGDNDLLVLHPFHNITIVTPGDFMKLFS